MLTFMIKLSLTRVFFSVCSHNFRSLDLSEVIHESEGSTETKYHNASWVRVGGV